MKLRKLAVSAVAITLCAGAFHSAAHAQETHYFAFVTSGPGDNPDDTVGNGKLTYAPHEFVIAVSKPSIVEQMQAILIDNYVGRSVHVMGQIERGRKDYNQEWPYHLVPESIELFSNTTEVCDATSFQVEDHLDLVDTPDSGFLPGGIWCPWTSRLVREVKYTPPAPSVRQG